MDKWSSPSNAMPSFQNANEDIICSALGSCGEDGEYVGIYSAKGRSDATWRACITGKDQKPLLSEAVPRQCGEPRHVAATIRNKGEYDIGVTGDKCVMFFSKEKWVAHSDLESAPRAIEYSKHLDVFCVSVGNSVLLFRGEQIVGSIRDFKGECTRIVCLDDMRRIGIVTEKDATRNIRIYTIKWSQISRRPTGRTSRPVSRNAADPTLRECPCVARPLDLP